MKNPKASFALAKYLTDEDFQKVQNKTGRGRLPTLKSAGERPDLEHRRRAGQAVRGTAAVLAHLAANRADHDPQCELDGAEGARRSPSRARRALARLADANQRVNDAIKEGRAD